MKARCPFCYKDIDCTEGPGLLRLLEHSRSVNYQYEDCGADWYSVSERCPGSGDLIFEKDGMCR